MRLIRYELANNAYAREIDAALPRVLALADRDPLSPTRGFGDRQYWAWKLIDFPNGTLQGAVNGLSALLAADAFAAHVSCASIQHWINDMLAATPRMMRRDGSFEEALPFEQSYCVTALVVYDYLVALDRSGADPARVHLIEKAVDFLIRRDETHGFISNHLATAVAALFLWQKLTGDIAARRKAEALCDRILSHQSSEGWFVEYGCADPGYQTLCMTHLADAARSSGDDRIWEALEKAAGFVEHFVHPDGSFGGVYGSRATRIYYPAGLEMLASRSDAARGTAIRMRSAIARAATVPLAAIDQPNLLPVFNNYCQALLAAPDADSEPSNHTPTIGRTWFPEAGLLVDRGEIHHTIVSTRKGGIVYHWRKGRLVVCDTGIVVRGSGHQVLTSQIADAENVVEVTNESVSVSGKLRRRRVQLPNPFNFLILRIMAATIMRVPAVNAWVKLTIARMLVHSGGTEEGKFTRRIILGCDLEISDRWEPDHLTRIVTHDPFSAIHMASSGYWQITDSEAGQ